MHKMMKTVVKSLYIVYFWNIPICYCCILLAAVYLTRAARQILGDNYISYNVACTLLNVMPLRYRRTELCTSFAIKLYKSSRSADFFLPAKKNVNVRNKNMNLVIEQKCNTKRAYNAPHNYLARLINKNSQKIRK